MTKQIGHNDDHYLEIIASTANDKIREDIVKTAKFIMIKRAVVKVAEIIILGTSAMGILPAFL